MLEKTLHLVRNCLQYKKLMKKTIHFDEMWFEVAEYQRIQEDCIHVCLPQITVNPFNDSDICIENEMECYFNGRGIFCLAFNTDKVDCSSMDYRYNKVVVPLKKHVHRNCEIYSVILCDVHEDPQLYIEKISFAKRHGMVRK